MERAQPAYGKLKASLSVFKSQKQGNEPSEYEDASEPSLSGELLSERLSVAISDGATESSFASLWASVLVAAFVNSGLPADERFKKAVNKGARIWRRIVDPKTLPWYAEEKRKRGAFATFLGTCFGEDGSWEAIAAGDSCLFVKKPTGVVSFPISDEKEFGSTPPLICSRRSEREMPSIKSTRGEWSSGDLFFWMTDAAAQWFLHELNAGLFPWEVIASFADTETFLAWLSSARGSGIMRNDDVTILMLRVE